MWLASRLGSSGGGYLQIAELGQVHAPKCRKGLSLTETVIALFLLSYVAVMAMTQMAFSVHRQTDRVMQATLLSRSVVAQIRSWAANPDNFRAGWSSWTRYDGRTEYDSSFPGYRVKVEVVSGGRALDTPCSGLEKQFTGKPEGKRTLPAAVIPVTITVNWSDNPSDAIQTLTYVGEPKLNIDPGSHPLHFTSSKSPADLKLLSNGQVAQGDISARDDGGVEMKNLLYTVQTQGAYIRRDLVQSQRSGRHWAIKRINNPKRLPLGKVPAANSFDVQASYAGHSYTALQESIILK